MNKPAIDMMELLKKLNNYFVQTVPGVNRLISPAKFFIARHVVARAIKHRIQSLIMPHYERLSSVNADNSKKKAVIVATFIHEYYRYLLSDATIALLLRERGVYSTIIYNGTRDFYRQWLDETNPTHANYLWEVSQKVDSYLRQYLPKLYRPFIGFDLPPSEEIDRIAHNMIDSNCFELHGQDLHYHITISVGRYYRSTPKMTEFEPDYQQTLFEQTRNAIKSFLLAEQVEKECKPDIVVMSLSLYSFWGPMYDFFKASGIKTVLVYPQDQHKHNATNFHIRNLTKSDYERIYNHIENQKENKKAITDTVDGMLKQRFDLQSRDLTEVTIIHSDQKKEQEFTSHLDDLRQQGIAIYGMFPNLLYDYSYSTRKGAFPYIIDWITETVRYFESQSDKKLILKLHPVEQNPRARPRVNPITAIEKILALKESDLKNVIIVKPEDKISSYRLFPYLTAGLLYTGTLGIEMLYKRIPIINGTNEAPFAGFGFTIDPQDRDSYFHYLSHPEKVKTFQEDKYDKIMTFIFIYLHVNQMPVSFVKEAPHRAMQDTSLNRVVDQIVDSSDTSYLDHIFHPTLKEILDSGHSDT